MGGKSNKTNSTTTNILGSTTTANPYVKSITNNNGTNTAFQNGTALESIYNKVNNNIGNLLDEYLNPTLNSNTNKAKLNSFQNTLNNKMYKNLENNIVNPLSNRNMIRSSQATDIYKNASNQASSQIANFTNELLSNSQNETADVINNLLNAYIQGYNVVNNNQAASLDTSKSNSTINNTSSVNNKDSLLDWLNFINDWKESDAQIFSSIFGSKL